MADFSGYSINDTAFHVAVAQQMIADIAQRDIYQDGLGIIQITAEDFGAAAVRIPKIKRATGEFRELGNATNGAYTNSTSASIKGLDEEIVNLKNLYDEMEDVPNVQNILSLANASSVSRRVQEIAKAITRGRNAGTMAHQIAAVINDAVTAESGTGLLYTYTAATEGDALAKLRAANASLDNGDGSYHDTFPIEGRVSVCRPTYLPDLLENGNIIVGGSNFAQEIVSSGAVSPEIGIGDLPENVYGYRGMVLGVPVMIATDPLWTAAESWLGLSAGALDDFQAILASHIATGRGQAFPEQIKIIDSPNVNGLRIQPLSNFGVEVLFSKGIKLITDAAVTFTADSGDFHDALTPLAPGSKS